MPEGEPHPVDADRHRALGSPAPNRRATAGVVEYARNTISPTIVCSTAEAMPEPRERRDAEVADERGVHDQEQRLGDERAERGHGEPQDVAVQRVARGARRCSPVEPTSATTPRRPARRGRSPQAVRRVSVAGRISWTP